MLKNSYFRALGFAQVDRILRAARRRKGDLIVLNLHRVSPRGSPYWPPLAPEAFEALVQSLHRHSDVLTFASVAERASSTRIPLVLSFDDGCRDFVEYAMPVLERHGLPANQNVIVQSVETGRPPWTIAAADALAAAGTARVRALNVPGFRYRLEGDSDRAKAKYGAMLVGYLKRKPPAERSGFDHDVRALIDETEPDAFTPMMSRSDTELVAETHELGCHSYSHESMALMSAADFSLDIDRCERFFSSLGRPMRIFAFPNGSYRAEQIDDLLRRGVEHVLLVDECFGGRASHVHPRITMYGDSDQELRMRAMGWKAPSWIKPFRG